MKEKDLEKLIRGEIYFVPVVFSNDSRQRSYDEVAEKYLRKARRDLAAKWKAIYDRGIYVPEFIERYGSHDWYGVLMMLDEELDQFDLVRPDEFEIAKHWQSEAIKEFSKGHSFEPVVMGCGDPVTLLEAPAQHWPNFTGSEFGYASAVLDQLRESEKQYNLVKKLAKEKGEPLDAEGESILQDIIRHRRKAATDTQPLLS